MNTMNVVKVETKVRRGVYAPQREGETFAQYTQRIADAKAMDAERKRLKRAALRNTIEDTARKTLYADPRFAGTIGQLSMAAMDRERFSSEAERKQAAVLDAMRTKGLDPSSRIGGDILATLTAKFTGFSKAQNKRSYAALVRSVDELDVLRERDMVQALKRLEQGKQYATLTPAERSKAMAASLVGNVKRGSYDRGDIGGLFDWSDYVKFYDGDTSKAIQACYASAWWDIVDSTRSYGEAFSIVDGLVSGATRGRVQRVEATRNAGLSNLWETSELHFHNGDVAKIRTNTITGSVITVWIKTADQLALEKTAKQAKKSPAPSADATPATQPTKGMWQPVTMSRCACRNACKCRKSQDVSKTPTLVAATLKRAAKDAATRAEYLERVTRELCNPFDAATLHDWATDAKAHESMIGGLSSNRPFCTLKYFTR